MNSVRISYSIIVPTLNGGVAWSKAAHAIRAQSPAPQRVVIIDSGSSDGSVEISRNLGFEVIEIHPFEFDHGRTRQLGVEQLENEAIVVFLTQDAVMQSRDAVARLIKPFENATVGAAYGRQLPGKNASIFEKHARGNNYPANSIVKSQESICALGIRTAFCSNSFSAYRRSVLMEVGGFPNKTLFAEDMLVAAKMILAGYSIAYQADAVCEHWHDYGIIEEFKRAFDIGVFHHREHWILEKFGSAEGEGRSLILTGLRRIAAENPMELPVALMKYAAKTVGYATGRVESTLPLGLKRRFSMNRAFWNANV